MHILIVSNYFEPDVGEAATRNTSLARFLHQQGHQITVLTSLPHYPDLKIHEGYRGRLVVTEDRDGIRVIQTWLFATPSPRISRRIPGQISFMLTAILRGLGIPRPDVVFIEAQPIFTGFAGVFLSKIKRVPYVMNVSDLLPDALLTLGRLKETDRLYRIARQMADYTYRHAAGIVCMSPYWEQTIHKYIGPTDKTETIYRGCDLDQFNPSVDPTGFRQKYDLHAPKIISFIGTFALQYDFPTMMALAAHYNDNPDVQVVFIGKGNQANILRTHLASPEYSSTRWIEWVGSEDIAAAWTASYLNFWAMGTPKLYSGTIPAKLFEALASGTPVVAASDVSGAGGQTIQATGAAIVTPPGDAEAFIAAAQSLIDDDSLRQRLSETGRAYAEQHYDPAKIRAAYEQAIVRAAR
jgi:glycosyltransferase involved in cell wall biosynthesis